MDGMETRCDMALELQRAQRVLMLEHRQRLELLQGLLARRDGAMETSLQAWEALDHRHKEDIRQLPRKVA